MSPRSVSRQARREGDGDFGATCGRSICQKLVVARPRATLSLQARGATVDRTSVDWVHRKYKTIYLTSSLEKAGELAWGHLHTLLLDRPPCHSLLFSFSSCPSHLHTFPCSCCIRPQAHCLGRPDPFGNHTGPFVWTRKGLRWPPRRSQASIPSTSCRGSLSFFRFWRGSGSVLPSTEHTNWCCRFRVACPRVRVSVSCRVCVCRWANSRRN